MKTFTPRRLAGVVAASVFGTMLGIATSSIAKDDDDKGGGGNEFSARLSGFNEVHFNAGPPATLRGAVSTAASGSFRLRIDEPAGLIHYELTYQDLEGDVRQSHIHFGQRHTVGGITIWLCQTTQNPSPVATTPVCPGPRGGTVTGIITQADVVAPAGQGIAAGDLAAAIRAIRAGTTYANVHTALYAPGEIRGHIRKGGGHGKGK